MAINTRPFITAYKTREARERVHILKIDKPVNAGSQSDPIILFLKNVSGFDLTDIYIKTSDNDVEITPNFIKMMKIGEIIEIVFVWKPKQNRETALSTKIISVARRIVRP